MLAPAEEESLKNWVSSNLKNPCASGQGHGRMIWDITGSFFTRETKGCPHLSNCSLWECRTSFFSDMHRKRQWAASETSNTCKETMFYYEGSGSGAEKVRAISIFAGTQWLTKKGLNSLVFNLGLPEHWVRLGDLLKFRVNYPVHRHKFCFSCLC